MSALITTIYYFYRIISAAILIYCIGSWFVRPGTKLFYYWQKLGMLLEPLFRPARVIMNALNLYRLRIDFTPWLTMILLELVFGAIIKVLSIF